MILVPVKNLVDAKQGSLGCPRARTGLGLSSQLVFRRAGAGSVTAANG